MAKKQDASAKVLRIACEAAAVVPYKKLTPLQGDLKILDPEDRVRLRTSLLEHGFSFPVHAWREQTAQGELVWIMDAHQRLDVINELAGEGYEIPDLPVAWVQADTRAEALKKLASSASQYGRVTPDGLYKFTKMANISLNSLTRMYRFPEINMAKYQQAYHPQINQVSFAAKAPKHGGEISEDSLGAFKHTCPKCGFGFDK